LVGVEAEPTAGEEPGDEVQQFVNGSLSTSISRKYPSHRRLRFRHGIPSETAAYHDARDLMGGCTRSDLFQVATAMRPVRVTVER
jgi:hypothetical protein